jgi:AraC-like DNA-binding protein
MPDPSAPVPMLGASAVQAPPGVPVVVGAPTVPDGDLLRTNMFSSIEPEEWDQPVHPEHELLWSMGGSVSVETDGRFWLVPASLGIWIPAGTRHVVRASTGSITCATFVDPRAISGAWGRVTSVSMHAALRELLRFAYLNDLPEAERRRLHRVALDLLRPARSTPLDLRMPAEPLLRRLAELVTEDVADDRTTEAWAAEFGMSARTLTRGFVRETGQTFARWRMLARVRAALELLGAGHGVTAVAGRVGYANPSTFIDLFRRVTGQTPAAYVRATAGAAVESVEPPVQSVQSRGSIAELGS